jgi:hypothetical protein
MDLIGTGAQLSPLTTGNNDNPTLSQGAQTSFFFNSIPDRCPTAPLAYYLPVILLTFIFNIVQPASGGSLIYWDQIPKCLFTSLQLQNAWHGTPISANHVLGTNWPAVEFYSNGFRTGARRRPPIPAASGTYPVRATFAVTPSVSRLGRLMGDTAQLAKCFQQAQLQINVAPASVLAGISTGATISNSNFSARATAVLVPRNELILGTPVETIMHQIVAGSNSNQIQIKGFGTNTFLTGVQNKGGVVFLSELSSNLGGVFATKDVTFFNFAWRGQGPTYDMDAFFAANSLGNMPNDRSQVMGVEIAGGDAEFTDPPYAMNTSDDWLDAGFLGDKANFGNLYGWNMVQGGNDLALTDVQTADSDQDYYMTVTGGFNAGAHLILAQYAKAWNQSMLDDWLKLVTDGGSSSLAAYVLGSNYASANLKQRPPKSKHIITPDNAAYLPFQLYNAGHAV